VKIERVVIMAIPDTVVLPLSLIQGLRLAIDAGMSCDQIVATLTLGVGVYEAMDHFQGGELMTRVESLALLMRGGRDRERF
jgi:hypothetical protein